MLSSVRIGDDAYFPMLRSVLPIGYFDILGVTFPKEIAVILKIWAYQFYTLECMIRISHQFLRKIAPYQTFKNHDLYLHFPTTNK